MVQSPLVVFPRYFNQGLLPSPMPVQVLGFAMDFLIRQEADRTSCLLRTLTLRFVLPLLYAA